MELNNQKLVRFYNDGKQQNLEFSRERRDIHWERRLPVNKIAPEQDPEGKIGINDKNRINIKVPTLGKYKVFPENHDPWKKQIIDPGSDMYLLWNRVFLCTCILALFVDPLIFYFPSIVNDGNTSCMGTDMNLGIVVTCFRTFADLFYLMNIVIKFRTAYVSPSSRVFGRGELVMDPRMIARRYLRSEFFLDLLAAIPLPQIVIWFIMPAIRSSHSDHTNNTLLLIVLLQYIPRLYLIFPLSSQIIKATGVVTKTAWAGAAYNLLLYMLGSHVSGAAWYLLSMERNAVCLKTLCLQQIDPLQCRLEYLDCSTLNRYDRVNWANSTSVFNDCSSGNATIFNLGIFAPAVTNNAFSINFTEKYLYCLWWGLQNLSCYAQTLIPSTYIGETTFAIVIALLGLILFALLIGNMQNYLQSLTVRLEEWRLRRRDTEEWMKHRQLPQNLRERVRRFVQYKWVATRGVDEEDILRGLPLDLRRDIQRHLRLDFVRRVPFFSQMDDQLQDAICERLVSSLSTQGTYVYREGDPVTEMLFIIRGKLESSTTDGGRTGFFNSITLNPGDFCGEELLAWALLPKSTHNLPTSTRTVKALVEVEAFALRAEDLKFVANQFRRLHSKKLQHTFRFYSHHWRTWAACFIQAAWRQYKKRKMVKSPSLRESESFNYDEHFKDDDGMEQREEEEQSVVSSSSTSQLKNNLGVTIMASMFAANARRGKKLRKPDEPDFSM